MTRYATLATPAGTVVIAGDGGVAVTGLWFDRGRVSVVRESSGEARGCAHNGDIPPDWTRDDDAFVEARRQLGEWFDGTRRDLTFEIAPDGTAFQHRVWAALRRIPYGSTRTYGDLARELGTAPRAVGRANGSNPLSIVIPCHRLVGSDGALRGYLGGTGVKRWLLDHERRMAGNVGYPSLRP